MGTFLPSNVSFLRVPDKSQAGEQLDQLCQEDCSCGYEHVPGPDAVERYLYAEILQASLQFITAVQSLCHLVLAYRMDRPSTAFCPVSVTRLKSHI